MLRFGVVAQVQTPGLALQGKPDSGSYFAGFAPPPPSHDHETAAIVRLRRLSLSIGGKQGLYGEPVIPDHLANNGFGTAASPTALNLASRFDGLARPQ